MEISASESKILQKLEPGWKPWFFPNCPSESSAASIHRAKAPVATRLLKGMPVILYFVHASVSQL